MITVNIDTNLIGENEDIVAVIAEKFQDVLNALQNDTFKADTEEPLYFGEVIVGSFITDLEFEGENEAPVLEGNVN